MSPRLAVVPDADPNRIDDLLASFELAMRAAARSPRTVALHVGGARRFAAWLDAQGRSTAIAHITPDDVRGFILARADAGLAANTVSVDHRAIRALFRWAVDDGLVTRDPSDRVRAPKVVQKMTPVFTDADLRALFDACAGSRFLDRRDMALLRLLADTGMRRAELVGLNVSDVDTKGHSAVIRHAKGGRQRVVGFGDRTAVALDRYLRVRKQHRHAALPDLWLSRVGALTFGALRVAIAARAARAGVVGVRPHRFRHTMASRWLAAGGQEGDLMALGGWSNARLIHTVYGVATRAERALDAHRRLGLGDKV